MRSDILPTTSCSTMNRHQAFSSFASAHSARQLETAQQCLIQYTENWCALYPLKAHLRVHPLNGKGACYFPNLWEGEGGMMEHVAHGFPMPPRTSTLTSSDKQSLKNDADQVGSSTKSKVLKERLLVPDLHTNTTTAENIIRLESGTGQVDSSIKSKTLKKRSIVPESLESVDKEIGTLQCKKRKTEAPALVNMKDILNFRNASKMDEPSDMCLNNVHNEAPDNEQDSNKVRNESPGKNESTGEDITKQSYDCLQLFYTNIEKEIRTVSTELKIKNKLMRSNIFYCKRKACEHVIELYRKIENIDARLQVKANMYSQIAIKKKKRLRKSLGLLKNLKEQYKRTISCRLQNIDPYGSVFGSVLPKVEDLFVEPHKLLEKSKSTNGSSYSTASCNSHIASCEKNDISTVNSSCLIPPGSACSINSVAEFVNFRKTTIIDEPSNKCLVSVCSEAFQDHKQDKKSLDSGRSDHESFVQDVGNSSKKTQIERCNHLHISCFQKEIKTLRRELIKKGSDMKRYRKTERNSSTWRSQACKDMIDSYMKIKHIDVQFQAKASLYDSSLLHTHKGNKPFTCCELVLWKSFCVLKGLKDKFKRIISLRAQDIDPYGGVFGCTMPKVQDLFVEPKITKKRGCSHSNSSYNTVACNNDNAGHEKDNSPGVSKVDTLESTCLIPSGSTCTNAMVANVNINNFVQEDRNISENEKKRDEKQESVMSESLVGEAEPLQCKKRKKDTELVEAQSSADINDLVHVRNTTAMVNQASTCLNGAHKRALEDKQSKRKRKKQTSDSSKTKNESIVQDVAIESLQLSNIKKDIKTLKTELMGKKKQMSESTSYCKSQACSDMAEFYRKIVGFDARLQVKAKMYGGSLLYTEKGKEYFTGCDLKLWKCFRCIKRLKKQFKEIVGCIDHYGEVFGWTLPKVEDMFVEPQKIIEKLGCVTHSSVACNKDIAGHKKDRNFLEISNVDTAETTCLISSRLTCGINTTKTNNFVHSENAISENLNNLDENLEHLDKMPMHVDSEAVQGREDFLKEGNVKSGVASSGQVGSSTKSKSLQKKSPNSTATSDNSTTDQAGSFTNSKSHTNTSAVENNTNTEGNISISAQENVAESMVSESVDREAEGLQHEKIMKDRKFVETPELADMKAILSFSNVTEMDEPANECPSNVQMEALADNKQKKKKKNQSLDSGKTIHLSDIQDVTKKDYEWLQVSYIKKDIKTLRTELMEKKRQMRDDSYCKSQACNDMVDFYRKIVSIDARLQVKTNTYGSSLLYTEKGKEHFTGCDLELWKCCCCIKRLKRQFKEIVSCRLEDIDPYGAVFGWTLPKVEDMFAESQKIVEKPYCTSGSSFSTAVYNNEIVGHERNDSSSGLNNVVTVESTCIIPPRSTCSNAEVVHANSDNVVHETLNAISENLEKLDYEQEHLDKAIKNLDFQTVRGCDDSLTEKKKVNDESSVNSSGEVGSPTSCKSLIKGSFAPESQTGTTGSDDSTGILGDSLISVQKNVLENMVSKPLDGEAGALQSKERNKDSMLVETPALSNMDECVNLRNTTPMDEAVAAHLSNVHKEAVQDDKQDNSKIRNQSPESGKIESVVPPVIKNTYSWIQLFSMKKEINICRTQLRKINKLMRRDIVYCTKKAWKDIIDLYRKIESIDTRLQDEANMYDSSLIYTKKEKNHVTDCDLEFWNSFYLLNNLKRHFKTIVGCRLRDIDPYGSVFGLALPKVQDLFVKPHKIIGKLGTNISSCSSVASDSCVLGNAGNHNSSGVCNVGAVESMFMMNQSRSTCSINVEVAKANTNNFVLKAKESDGSVRETNENISGESFVYSTVSSGEVGNCVKSNLLNGRSFISQSHTDAVESEVSTGAVGDSLISVQENVSERRLSESPDGKALKCKKGKEDSIG